MSWKLSTFLSRITILWNYLSQLIQWSVLFFLQFLKGTCDCNVLDCETEEDCRNLCAGFGTKTNRGILKQRCSWIRVSPWYYHKNVRLLSWWNKDIFFHLFPKDQSQCSCSYPHSNLKIIFRRFQLITAI